MKKDGIRSRQVMMQGLLIVFLFWFRQCKENYGAICMMNQERR